jgi:hypothetical protein
LERKSLLQRFESVKFILWVWHRAHCRGRSPRGRILAVLLANAVLNADPWDLDRAEISRQEERWRQWEEIRRRERERIGIEPESDAVWELFEREHGKGPRVLELPAYPPRLAKRSLSRVPDAAFDAVDRTLLQAFKVLWDDPEQDNLLVMHSLAAERIAAIDAKRRLSKLAHGDNLKRSANGLLMDTVLFQTEVLRGRARRIWFCVGCDWWHTYSKGAPARYHRALMGMQLKAATIRGVGRGDGKRIYQEVRRSQRWPMPSQSRWYKFIKQHHLRRQDDLRTVVMREEGRWRLTWVDLGRKVD